MIEILRLCCVGFFSHPSTIQLVKQISKSQGDPPHEAPARHQDHENGHEVSLGHGNIQSNALQNWQTNMRVRRRQQHYLSGELMGECSSLQQREIKKFILVTALTSVQLQVPHLKQIKELDICEFKKRPFCFQSLHQCLMLVC